jgi:pteridine reductase
MDLRGKLAVVTGGARRVGRAIVEALAEIGAKPVIHYYRSHEEARALARATDGVIVQADLSASEGAQRLVEAVLDLNLEIAVWVNSAAGLERAPFLASDEELWRRTLQLVLLSPMSLSRLVAPHMMQGGVIINILDVAAHQVWAGYSHHCVAKAGLHMFTRCLAVELGPKLRVCGVTPGLLQTLDGQSPWPTLASKIPLGREGEPRDVGQTVKFLVESDYITGSVIAVDGGLMTRTMSSG